MTRKMVLFLLIVATVLASGCSTGSYDDSISFQWWTVDGGGYAAGNIDIKPFEFEPVEAEPEEHITLKLFGNDYEGVFYEKKENFPFLNTLFYYQVLDPNSSSDPSYLARVGIDSKSGEIVTYSSFLEMTKERKYILSEEELKAIADTYASRFISLEEYTCICSPKKENDEKTDYVFYYKRYINDIELPGKVTIFLTCDGRLLTFRNALTEEWDYAINQMGEEYYEEKAALLTSELVLRELDQIMIFRGVTKWKIEEKSLVLLDDIHVGLFCRVFCIYMQGNYAQASRNRYVVTEEQ